VTKENFGPGAETELVVAMQELKEEIKKAAA